MVRLNAFQRTQDPPDIIQPYCMDTEDLQTASRYRMIVCTCNTAGQLYSLGLSSGYFTHVFVDEVRAQLCLSTR